MTTSTTTLTAEQQAAQLISDMLPDTNASGTVKKVSSETPSRKTTTKKSQPKAATVDKHFELLKVQYSELTNVKESFDEVSNAVIEHIRKLLKTDITPSEEELLTEMQKMFDADVKKMHDKQSTASAPTSNKPSAIKTVESFRAKAVYKLTKANVAAKIKDIPSTSYVKYISALQDMYNYVGGILFDKSSISEAVDISHKINILDKDYDFSKVKSEIYILGLIQQVTSDKITKLYTQNKDTHTRSATPEGVLFNNLKKLLDVFSKSYKKTFVDFCSLDKINEGNIILGTVVEYTYKRKAAKKATSRTSSKPCVLTGLSGLSNIRHMQYIEVDPSIKEINFTEFAQCAKDFKTQLAASKYKESDVLSNPEEVISNLLPTYDNIVPYIPKFQREYQYSVEKAVTYLTNIAQTLYAGEVYKDHSNVILGMIGDRIACIIDGVQRATSWAKAIDSEIPIFKTEGYKVSKLHSDPDAVVAAEIEDCAVYYRLLSDEEALKNLSSEDRIKLADLKHQLDNYKVQVTVYRKKEGVSDGEAIAAYNNLFKIINTASLAIDVTAGQISEYHKFYNDLLRVQTSSAVQNNLVLANEFKVVNGIDSAQDWIPLTADVIASQVASMLRERQLCSWSHISPSADTFADSQRAMETAYKLQAAGKILDEDGNPVDLIGEATTNVIDALSIIGTIDRPWMFNWKEITSSLNAVDADKKVSKVRVSRPYFRAMWIAISAVVQQMKKEGITDIIEGFVNNVSTKSFDGFREAVHSKLEKFISENTIIQTSVSSSTNTRDKRENAIKSLYYIFAQLSPTEEYNIDIEDFQANVTSK